MRKRALFLCAELIISATAMFGQELPTLKVTEREMNGIIDRCAGDNETVVEIQSYLFLTFESTMDKTVNFCDMKQENGFYVYKLLFPTGDKYKGRKLKIKSSGFDTYTQPLLDLKAKIPIGLLVFNGTKSIADDLFNQGKFAEALREYEKLYSINPNDAYIKDRIDVCSNKINNGNNVEIQRLQNELAKYQNIAIQQQQKEAEQQKQRDLEKQQKTTEQSGQSVNNQSSSYANNSNSYNSSGSYKYQTTFDNPVFNVPLRVGPNINSREIYTCPKKSIVYVIDNSGETYYKVRVDGYVGYVSKGFLKTVVPSSSYTNNSNSYNSSSSYKYQTIFDNPVFNVPLRVEPNINSREIYTCPKKSTVYVIDNSGEVYYKVRVDGYVGYVSKKFLKRK